jgi:hypothetical protein
MEPEGSSPCSQQPAIGPYSKPDQSNPPNIPYGTYFLYVYSFVWRLSSYQHNRKQCITEKCFPHQHVRPIPSDLHTQHCISSVHNAAIYILQKESYSNESWTCLENMYYHTRSQNPSPVAALRPHHFARPVCWYHWWYQIWKYWGGVTSSRVVFIPNFGKIRSLVQTLLRGIHAHKWWCHKPIFITK